MKIFEAIRTFFVLIWEVVYTIISIPAYLIWIIADKIRDFKRFPPVNPFRLHRRYKWGVCILAPKSFPVFVDHCDVKYGKDCAVSCNGVDCTGGIGNGEYIASGVGKSCPTGVDIVWASYKERKWYAGSFQFCKADREDIDIDFKLGFDGCARNFRKNTKPQNLTYEKIGVCCLPGGEVRIYLIGRGRTICPTLITCKATEIRETDAAILHGPNSTNYPDFAAWDAGAGHGAKDMPHELWKRYYKEYKYDINITVEDRESSLYHEACKFTNGESFSLYTGINPSNTINGYKAAIMQMNLKWIFKEYYYYARLFFQEEETLRMFEETKERPFDPSTLEIRIGKDNKHFDIVLKHGEEQYSFNAVEIEVFRTRGYEGKKEKVYSNCDYKHRNRFVGS